MLDHISIQAADYEASLTFYDSVLGALGYGMLVDRDSVAGYGERTPVFWVGAQTDGDGFRQTHIAFTAPTREAVDAYYAAATALGAEVLYAPKDGPSTTRATTRRSYVTRTATTSRPSVTTDASLIEVSFRVLEPRNDTLINPRELAQRLAGSAESPVTARR